MSDPPDAPAASDGWGRASRVLDRKTVAHHEAGHVAAFEVLHRKVDSPGTPAWTHARIYRRVDATESEYGGGTSSTVNLVPEDDAVQWMAGLAAEALLREREAGLSDLAVAEQIVDGWLPFDGSNDRENAVCAVCDVLGDGGEYPDTALFEAAIYDERVPEPVRGQLISATLKALSLLRAAQNRWREIAARLIDAGSETVPDPLFGEVLESRVTWDDVRSNHG